MSEQGPAWTMIGRNKLKPSELIPGPGTYQNIQPTLPKEPKFTISKANRFSSQKSLEPGPGSYQTHTLNSLVRPTIDKAKRHSIADPPNAYPGPGTYDIQANLQGPSFSLSGRSSKELLPSIPGPGPAQYNPNPILPKSPHLSFGSQKRSSSLQKVKEIPGPADYYIKADAKPGFKFGSQSRQSSGNQVSPGPGSYSPVSSFGTSGYSIRGRIIQQSISNSPGPGQYEVKSKIDNRTASVGRQPRFIHLSKQENPGPGTYRFPVSHLFQNARPVIGFSERKTIEVKNSSPGPGTYRIESSVRKVGCSLGRRFLVREAELTPGPGAYNAFIEEKAHRHGFGRDKRMLQRVLNEKIPGPGTYQTGERNQNGWKFGSSVRSVSNLSNGPGPGNYTIKRSFGN